MAFGAGSGLCNANNNTAGSSWSGIAISNNVPVGRLAIIQIGSDNGSVTSNTSTTANLHQSVTDTQGNTWVKVAERVVGAGSANAGTCTSVFYSKITTALTAGTDTLTVTLGESLTNKVAVGFFFTRDTAKDIAFEGVSSTTGTRSVNSSTLTSGTEYIVWRGLCFEDNENVIDTATASWTACADSAAFTTGGGATANCAVGAEFIITTGSGSTVTSNPTGGASGDGSSIIVGFKEISTGTALTVADCVSATTADGGVTLSPKTALTVANAASASLADNAVLTFHGTGLTVANANSATLAGAVTLSPKTTLTVAAAVSASLADNVTITVPGTALAPDPANSRSTAGIIGPEIILNGDFPSATTNWTAGNAGTLAINAGHLKVTNTGTFGYGYQSFTTVIGKLYRISIDKITGNTSQADAYVGVSPGNNINCSMQSLVDGTTTGTFVATATTTYISLVAASSTNGQFAEFDNVSIKDLGADFALTFHQGLIVANAVSAGLADNVTIAPKTALTVAAATSLTQAGAVVISPKTALVVANALSATLADNVAAVGHPVLTVAAAVSASIASNVTLTPRWALTVANANSASLADAVTITPKWALTVANALSATLADNVSLGGSIQLAPANATSASQAGNVTLSPKTTLAPSPAVSATLTDNVTVQPKTALSVAAATSASQASSVTIAPKTSLVVANATSASQAGNVTLSPKTALLVSSALSSTLADNVTLTPRWALTVASAVSLSSASNVTLAFNVALTGVGDAISATSATNVSLGLHYQLAANDAVSVTIATHIHLSALEKQAPFSRRGSPGMCMLGDRIAGAPDGGQRNASPPDASLLQRTAATKAD